MRGKWILRIVFSLLALLLQTGFFWSPWGEKAEMLALDAWFNFRGIESAPDDVVLVAMDEDSYQELDVPLNQAWPRELHAELLHRLAAAEVARVVFDVLFVGPSSDPEIDQELAEALSLIPTYIGLERSLDPGEYQIEQLLFPYEPFRENAKLALVNKPEDFGYIRRFKVSRSESTKQYPSLAEAGAGIEYFGKENLPGVRDMIWYYGPRESIKTYSYFEVLDPELVSDSDLKGKVVYVGLALRTGLGPTQMDSFLTPFMDKGRTFGVEIHATAAANLMSGKWVKRSDGWVETATTGALAMMLSFAICSLTPFLGILAILLAASLWILTSYQLFLSGLFIPGVSLFLIVLPAIYLLNTLYLYLVVQKAQRLTEKAFSMYLSPQMAKEMRQNPKALKLGGESVVATAMFTDIAGFTSISEGMTGQDVSHMLNCYFTEVMGTIFENDGTLIKFIGDAVFALWGAPIITNNHADLAYKTAKQISENVKVFNASGRFPPLDTRIGLHTGPMVVGNLGSARRFDYTAIGDSVNLASRVEGLNKYFGTDILITEECRGLIHNPADLVLMGSVQVVGKSEPVEVYSPIDKTSNGEHIDKWLRALKAFKSKDFQQSAINFSEIKSDSQFFSEACDLYLEQITRLRNQDLVDWRGDLIFSSK